MLDIKNNLLSDKVVEILRRKIFNYEIVPGERIIEADIAEELGMSRGPIREALRQIEKEDLVIYVPNKGYSVKELSSQDAWEIFFIRGSLEKLALQISNGKIDVKSLFIMEEALKEMKEAEREGNWIKVVEYDEVFHKEIIKAAGMERLVNLWSSLSGLNFSMFLTGKRANIFKIDVQYKKHFEMLEILKKGDLEESSKVLDEHYLKTGKKLYKYYSIKENEFKAENI